MFKIFKFFVNLMLIEICFGQFTSTIIKPKAPGSCGVSTGGPLIQQLSRPLSDCSGLFWADNGKKICYVERFGPAYGRYTPDDGRFNRMALNGTKGKESIAIIPVKDATDLRFVIGLDNKLILSIVTGTRLDLSSKVYNLMTISNRSLESFMRGKVDNKGRLWYSSGYDVVREKIKSQGRLYKIENLNKPEIMVNNLHIGGGMAWSKDYKHFYLVDNGLGVIYKYDFNDEEGTISNRKIIFNVTNHRNLEGKPFDIAMDEQGILWIGMVVSGVVLQYDEKTQKILWTIPLPASYVVSLEFGGTDKDILFVGTTNFLLYDPESEPGAGALYAITGLGTRGFPDNEIVIPDKYVKMKAN